MQGTYWLTVLPETSKLRPGIKKALSGVDSDAVIRPKFDTKGARRAGVQAGRDVQAGVEEGARTTLAARACAIRPGQDWPRISTSNGSTSSPGKSPSPRPSRKVMPSWLARYAAGSWSTGMT